MSAQRKHELQNRETQKQDTKDHTKLDLGLADPNLGMKECIDYQMDIGYWILEPKVSDNIQVHKFKLSGPMRLTRSHTYVNKT